MNEIFFSLKGSECKPNKINVLFQARIRLNATALIYLIAILKKGNNLFFKILKLKYENLVIPFANVALFKPVCRNIFEVLETKD